MSNASPFLHPDFVADALHLQGNSGAQLSLTTTADDTSALPGGIYAIWSTVDCYVSVHPTDATGVTTANGYLLRAGNTEQLYVPHNSLIGGIVAGGTGTLNYHKIG